MAENKFSKSTRMKMSNGTKRKIQSDILEFEVKKQVITVLIKGRRTEDN
jgi:hypothetical protein